MLITDKNKMDAFLPHTRVWQGIPSIEKTKGGRLFATFYSGNVKESAGNYCVLLQSDDDGKTWIDPIAVAYLNEDSDRCYDPCLWIDPLDRLWFTWAEHGCTRRVMAAICEQPDADELKWNTPMEIGGDVMMNKPIVLSSGEWLFPSAVWEKSLWVGPTTLVGGKDAKNGSKVYVSKDFGETFQELGGAEIPFRSFDEHMVFEKKDGTIEMYVRTRYGIGKSTSYDRGHTWSPGVDSGLKGPDTRFHIKRLRSGNVLVVNHLNYTGRNNLTAFLSTDDGETYPYTLLLDGRSNVSYPDAAEDEDGNIYIIYDRERGAFLSSLEQAENAAREILMVKITEEDIKSGNTDAVKPIIISKLGKYEGPYEDPYNTIGSISEEVFCKELLELSEPYAVLRQIFDRYGVSCENLSRVDRSALDNAMTELISGEDRLRLIEKIIAILTENKKADVGTDGIFTRISDYIRENITTEFSLDDMADALSASKFYLCHVFKEKTGTSVQRHVRELRMAKAKKMLLQSDASISDIAIECGFTDHSYFTKLFRIAEGMTPSEFRTK